MARKKTNPFKLRDFLWVNLEHIIRLEAMGVKTTDQMLRTGQTSSDRSDLAARAGIPPDGILELVKLSDLSRLPGVKGIRARLYYAAGVETVEMLSGYEPDELLRLTSEYVQRTGFPGIAPLPKEVSSTIVNARNLPKPVEW
jgi:predicted RecB family nuclease